MAARKKTSSVARKKTTSRTSSRRQNKTGTVSTGQNKKLSTEKKSDVPDAGKRMNEEDIISSEMEEKEKNRIQLGPVLTVAEIGDLYKQLQIQVDSSDDVYIDASQLQMLDMAGIQLLVVFIQELVKSDRKIHWQAPSTVFTQTAGLMDLSTALCLQDH